MSTPTISPNGQFNQSGIGYWMERVLAEREKVQADPSSDPVHDLRVALRRCRSMAETMSELDPEPAWKQMRKPASSYSKLWTPSRYARLDRVDGKTGRCRRP